MTDIELSERRGAVSNKVAPLPLQTSPDVSPEKDDVISPLKS